MEVRRIDYNGPGLLKVISDQNDGNFKELDYDPFLITFAEGKLVSNFFSFSGLIEKEHPYTYLSRVGFKELLEAPVLCFMSFF
jgi:hypothetical protein